MLSIGMPVYNSVGTVKKAVISILKQNYSSFQLIISDNCSNDGTYEVLEEISSTDARIELVRQSRNIGAIKNFEYVLFKSTGKYFMWAAADDFWLPTFCQKNIAFLEFNADYVSSISKVRYLDDNVYPEKKMGTFALVGTYHNNLVNYMLKPAANSRFYSVHRSIALKSSWVSDEFWAQDWSVVCNLLKFGKFNEIPSVLMIRGAGGTSKNPYKAISQNKTLSRIDKAIPLFKFSKYLLKEPGARNISTISMLLIYNVVYTLKMFSGWVRALFF